MEQISSILEGFIDFIQHILTFFWTFQSSLITVQASCVESEQLMRCDSNESFHYMTWVWAVNEISEETVMSGQEIC